MKPIREETLEFELKTAAEMVEKKEKWILDLALRETLSDLEYKDMKKTLTQACGSHAHDILSIFIIHNMDYLPLKTLDDELPLP